MSKDTKIRYGAIVHLQSEMGGYLDAHGRVNDQFIRHFKDPQIRGLVSTHSRENRLLGSGSWEILPVDEKPIGSPVKNGHKVHLRNISLNDEYLNSYEFIKNIPDFSDFFDQSPNLQKSKLQTIGIFTTSYERRGIWVIESKNDEVSHGEQIRLRQNWKGERFLFALGDGGATKKIDEFKGQKSLAFLGLDGHLPSNESANWTILKNKPNDSAQTQKRSLMAQPPLAYLNRYYLWGKIGNKWIDYGVIEYGGLVRQSIISLAVNFDQDGLEFNGKVNFKANGQAEVKGKKDEAGEPFTAGYSINPHFREEAKRVEPFPAENWSFSTYGDRKIHELEVQSPDDGQTLYGTITTSGQLTNEQKIEVKGVQASPVLMYGKQHELLNRLFSKSLWTKRNKKVADVLDAVESDLAIALNKLQIGYKANDGSYSYFDRKYDIKLPASLTNNPSVEDPIYQVGQMLNINSFSLSMQAFWDLLSEVSNAAVGKQQEKGFHPPVHRIRRSIDRLTIDFEILQSIIQQRNSIASEGDVNHFQANSLMLTDKLTARAIAPCHHLVSSSSDKIVPITYFNKRIHIRQTPYSDRFVLVGLTYDLISYSNKNDKDPYDPPMYELMAIPHEVGHFIYQHASLAVPKSMIDSAPQELKDRFELRIGRYEGVTFEELSNCFEGSTFYPWLEEMFADIYGCFVAGPLSVIGFQAILATDDSERIMMDDEEHPTPVLRPYIQSEMLRILHEIDPERYPFLDIAMSLDANWTAIIERLGFVPEDIKNGRPARVQIPDGSGSYFEDLINVRTLVAKSRLILRTFTHVLLENEEIDNRTSAAPFPWCNTGGNDGHRSISDYIEMMPDLVGDSDTTADEAYENLVKAYELDETLKDKIKSFLIDAEEDLLDDWHDSGPKGSGFGN